MARPTKEHKGFGLASHHPEGEEYTGPRYWGTGQVKLELRRFEDRIEAEAVIVDEGNGKYRRINLTKSKP